MFLTRLLQYYKHRIKVPGSLYQGKNRVIPPLSVKDKHRGVLRLLCEEDNLKILQKPFLSEQEEHGHMQGAKQNRWTKMLSKKRLNMLPHRFMEDELEHLNHNKKWE